MTCTATTSVHLSIVTPHISASNKWTPIQYANNPPPPRYGAPVAIYKSNSNEYYCADVLSDSAYLFGGDRADSSVVNDLWRFDFDTNTWTELKAKGAIPSPVFLYNYLIDFDNRDGGTQLWCTRVLCSFSAGATNVVCI